jgi:PilZ domain
VESRAERRFKPNQAATVRVLGQGPRPVLQATILDFSGKGMCLRVPRPVPSGTPVEIETNNLLARGSVLRCEPKRSSYELGVQLSETFAVSQPAR